MIRERAAQRFGVAHQGAPGFERRVQPLVRIHGDRVRGRERAEIGGRVGHRRGEPAVGAVDVEPHPVLPAQRGDRLERIHRTGAHRTGRADHDERQIARGFVFREALGEHRDVHPLRAGRSESI